DSDDRMQVDNPDEPFDGVTEQGLHFYDHHRNEIIFSAGDLEKHKKAENEQLWKDIEGLNYYDHTLLTKTAYSAKDMFGDFSEDATISSVIVAMSSLVIEISGAKIRSESSDEDARWAPHGSKTMFFLNLLDKLPRLQLSDDHLQAIIWVMKE
ncbi:hypothetical protein BU17DRAFT_6769, partial [Hysterangium stoloniferum]